MGVGNHSLPLPPGPCSDSLWCHPTPFALPGGMVAWTVSCSPAGGSCAVGQGLGESPHPSTLCLAPCRPNAAPAAGVPQTRLCLPLAPSHPAMPGAPAPEPHLLSPTWRPVCALPSPTPLVGMLRSQPKPIKYLLPASYKGPTALSVLWARELGGEGGSEGLGQRLWEGGAGVPYWLVLRP